MRLCTSFAFHHPIHHMLRMLRQTCRTVRMYATQTPKVASSLLPNGVRIHSLGNVDSNSKPCVVNVCVHAGSRFESENSAGSSAFLERAFYMSTTRRSSAQVLRALDEIGGNVTCTAQRECIIYSATIESVSVHKLAQTANILSDMVMSPAFKIADVETEKKSAVTDLSSLLQNTPVLINDLLHLSAFGKETLGRPVLMTPENLKKITPTSLRNFHDNFFQPSRIAVAAVNSNLSHESLSEILAPAFCAPEQLPVVATHTSGPMSRAQSRSLKAATYIGGESRLPSKGASHLHVVFQAESWRNREASAALSVLYSMLESPASSGRLPRAVMCSNGAMPLCQPVLFQYSDSGLFGIHAACRPNDSAKAIGLVTGEFVSLAQASTADLEIELVAAKQFTLDTLEAKFAEPVWLASEIGYRSLFRPDSDSPVLDMQYERSVIEKVDVAAIRKLVESMLSGQPTVFSFGSVPGNAPILPGVKAQLEATSRTPI